MDSDSSDIVRGLREYLRGNVDFSSRLIRLLNDSFDSNSLDTLAEDIDETGCSAPVGTIYDLFIALRLDALITYRLWSHCMVRTKYREIGNYQDAEAWFRDLEQQNPQYKSGIASEAMFSPLRPKSIHPNVHFLLGSDTP